MAEVMGDIKIRFDIEPSDQAKEYVRQVVLNTLKETLVESTWLQELLRHQVQEITREKGV